MGPASWGAQRRAFLARNFLRSRTEMIIERKSPSEPPSSASFNCRGKQVQRGERICPRPQATPTGFLGFKGRGEKQSEL